MKDKIIRHLIEECSLDERIVDGMFNPFIQEHMDVLLEKLFENEIPYEDIKEFNNKVMEGKYPERQAFNREGFLVTFPTPDYKAKALSSGNYFNYDPTHGKGGMHLVKKVGTAPDYTTSAVEKPDTAGVKEPIKPKIQKPVTSEPKAPETTSVQAPKIPVQKTQDSQIKTTPAVQAPSRPKKQEPSNSSAVDSSPPSKPETSTSTAPSKSSPELPEAPKLSKKEKTPVEYMTGEPDNEPLDLTDFSAYKDPSLEWAHNQKWEKRDNGNYYDDKGNLRAVIGLDGSAVPATENDRFSLRQWIDKKRQERLPGEKN